jgi:hypothetical protein
MSSLKVDTIQNRSGGTVTLTNQSAAKMIINYDQIADTVRSSLNVSTVNDVSTGEFTINFETSFNDINYSPSSASLAMATSSDRVGNFVGIKITSQSTPNARSVGLFTGSLKIDTGFAANQSNAGNEADSDANCVQIFGDLA